MEDKRINCGYEIVTALRCSKRMELVIGYNPEAPNRWVCWYCYDGNSYSTGDYCNTFKEALQSLADRINRNMSFSDFADLDK